MKYKKITFIALSLLLIATASHTCSMYNADQLAHRELSDSEAEELCDLFASQSLDKENDEMLFFNSDQIKKEHEEKQLRKHLAQHKKLYAELAGLVTPKKPTSSPILEKYKNVLIVCRWELVIQARREDAKKLLNQGQELEQKLLQLSENRDHAEAGHLKRQKIELGEKSPSTRRRSSRKRKKPAAPYSSYTSSFNAVSLSMRPHLLH